MSSNSSSDVEDIDEEWGRFLKNRVCYKELPGVINDKLLMGLLRKQMGGNEAKKLLLENGLNYGNITEIRIEFCKILRIDHLWLMKNLKILKMDNNFIEKIENLHQLTALIELDLSFNKIIRIENLDNLINLERLSLYENSISKIENMENLKNLTIFSIGRNNISDWKNIIYMRRLPKLRSLNMADNPCCTEKDFKYFIATYLPNLQYYEYRAITTIERTIGDEIFHDEYLLMLEKEQIELGIKYKQEKEEYEAKVNAESFVEYLNTRKLFESFFENDPEGSAFILMGGDVRKLYVNYEENIVGTCRDIFRMGQIQHDIREENLKEFNESVKQLHLQTQKDAIDHMEHFIEEKSVIFENLKDIRWQASKSSNREPSIIWKKFKDIEDSFEEISNSIWKNLMKLESLLYDQMMELNETYERALSDLINNFVEQAQGMFVLMRDSVAEYNDGVQEIAQIYYATVVFEEEEAEKDRLEAIKKKKEDELRAMKSEKEIQGVADEPIEITEQIPRKRVPSELRPYVKDRETLLNALAGSRDIHLLMVDNREDLLVSKARDWQQETIRVLYEDEIKRNREKILEITHFLDVQSNEFKVLASEMQNNLNIVISSHEI